MYLLNLVLLLPFVSSGLELAVGFLVSQLLADGGQSFFPFSFSSPYGQTSLPYIFQPAIVTLATNLSKLACQSIFQPITASTRGKIWFLLPFNLQEKKLNDIIGLPMYIEYCILKRVLRQTAK